MPSPQGGGRRWGIIRACYSTDAWGCRGGAVWTWRSPSKLCTPARGPACGHYGRYWEAAAMRKRLENWHCVFFAVMWAVAGWILVQASLYGILPRGRAGGSFTFADSPIAFVIQATSWTAF